MALLFCIDIKHCDVYYANVPRNHVAYSNAEIKTYEGYSLALGTQISAATSSPIVLKTGRSLQNWRVSHLTFHAIQYNNTAKLKFATELKQYLSDSLTKV